MRFSIIVPSYNQAPYLEDCLESILLQRGVDKEIIVMDGGSTDGSVEIIRRYEPHLAYWQSQPDGGQSAAINLGFEKATGDILSWLCSDDFLLPSALSIVEEAFTQKSPDIVVGSCLAFQDSTGLDSHILQASHPAVHSLRYANHIPQPSAFWTRSLWTRLGPLDESLHYTMDWEWFMRAELAGSSWLFLNRLLSGFRIHEGHKSSHLNDASAAEHERLWSQRLDAGEYRVLNRCVRRIRALYRVLSLLRRLGLREQQRSVVVAQIFGWHGRPDDLMRALTAARGRL